MVINIEPVAHIFAYGVKIVALGQHLDLPEHGVALIYVIDPLERGRATALILRSANPVSMADLLLL